MTPEQNEMLIRIDDAVMELRKDAADYEARLRVLERFRNWAQGGAALVGSALGFSKIPFS